MTTKNVIKLGLKLNKKYGQSYQDELTASHLRSKILELIDEMGQLTDKAFQEYDQYDMKIFENEDLNALYSLKEKAAEFIHFYNLAEKESRVYNKKVTDKDK
jgi:hypothetical protein